MTQRDHTIAADALAASKGDEEAKRRLRECGYDDTGIKPITKYMATDGTEHNSPEEARARNKDVMTEQKLQEFCELYFTTRDNDRDEIALQLFTHRKQLKSILLHAR